MTGQPSPHPWAPDTWRSKPADQQPAYPDPSALEDALARLAKLPPLVTSWEVEELKTQLARAARGERFVLQGGDCSESFDDCEPAAIASKLKILLQMSLVLIHGSKKRVIRIGRFAGQYAKPRSAPEETRDGLTLPAYRGDLINRAPFTAKDRVSDPELLLRGYERAALTLNFVRSLAAGGFADLHHPEQWDLGFISHSPLAEEYRKMLGTIGDAVRFLETVSGGALGELNRVEFYASHEGLFLPYEQAQTRRVPGRPGWYDLSTHFPWIGDRTRTLGRAHVEYFRGIANPIGVKIGPTATPDELAALLGELDPSNEPGRVTLIHRFGASRIGACLPPLVRKIRSTGRTVLWCSDPMHGNTETTPQGVKTRRFENILSELQKAFEIHDQEGSRLGGVHFELTGEDVTECLGGARGLTEADLPRAYRSLVDPRLNYDQSLEMAMLIARWMSRKVQ